jgi:beta-lactam-binding protein with PASTA domain
VDNVVAIPDVRGLSLAEARRILEEAGLQPEEALVALIDFSTAVVDFLDPPHGTIVVVGQRVVIFLRDTN